jgi:hypothetical protein
VLSERRMIVSRKISRIVKLHRAAIEVTLATGPALVSICLA